MSSRLTFVASLVPQANETFVRPANRRSVTVRFPAGQFQTDFSPATPTIAKLFDSGIGAKKGLAMVSVHLKSPGMVTGYGWQFDNPADTEMAAWLNDDAPIVGGITLLDILKQENFYIVVPCPVAEAEREWSLSRLPPAFSYGYGDLHAWNYDRFVRESKELQSKTPFTAAFRYVLVEYCWIFSTLR